jgi:hypothetical protein
LATSTPVVFERDEITERPLRKLMSALAFFITLLTAVAVAQVFPEPQAKNPGAKFSTNECVAKGGVGIVNTHLYVDLKSAKNELILEGGASWAGRPRDKNQVVVFFENEVWAREDLPQGFDLGKAIVVSFEGNLVRFFDFEKMSGGYYRRQIE